MRMSDFVAKKMKHYAKTYKEKPCLRWIFSFILLLGIGLILSMFLPDGKAPKILEDIRIIISVGLGSIFLVVFAVLLLGEGVKFSLKLFFYLLLILAYVASIMTIAEMAFYCILGAGGIG